MSERTPDGKSTPIRVLVVDDGSDLIAGLREALGTVESTVSLVDSTELLCTRSSPRQMILEDMRSIRENLVKWVIHAPPEQLVPKITRYCDQEPGEPYHASKSNPLRKGSREALRLKRKQARKTRKKSRK